MKTRVYIAAPKARASLAKSLAQLLRASSYEISSRWHDAIEDDAVDPSFESARSSICEENIADLRHADVTVVYLPEGGRATYWEAGFAAALSKRVIWFVPPTGEGRCIGDSFGSAMVVNSTEKLIGVLRTLGAMRGAA